MSSEEYDYDDEESGTESEGDEYYYEDESEEELEGGSYQLSTDYIDGIGMGYGGELMGGAAARKKKKCISDYNLFFKKYRKMGKSPEQIGKMWREGKGVMPARKAPKGRVLCKSQSRKRGYAPKKRKSTSGSKKTVRRQPAKRKPAVRRGTFCPENGRYYKTKASYDKYCATPKFMGDYPWDDTNTYYYSNCGPKARFCPLTRKCRSNPKSIIDCWNRASIPYFIGADGLPNVMTAKDSAGNEYFFKDQYALADAYPDKTFYTRGHVVGAKKKNLPSMM